MKLTPKQEKIIHLERLANRCKVYAFVDEADRLRAKADALNAALPEHLRIGTSTEFFDLVEAEIGRPGEAE